MSDIVTNRWNKATLSMLKKELKEVKRRRDALEKFVVFAEIAGIRINRSDLTALGQYLADLECRLNRAIRSL